MRATHTYLWRKKVEPYRTQSRPWISPPGVNYGLFFIRHNGTLWKVIASDGAEDIPWDHVSLTNKEHRDPTWEEMCYFKDLFFSEDEVVVQFHPAKKDYINDHPHCLHLWRFHGVMPCPDPLLVGLSRKD